MKQTEGFSGKSSDSDLKTGCIIMASGLSKRFGSNKLTAVFQGKTFIERALAVTDDIFDKRIVLTRSPEILPVCEAHGVKVILHELPGRNDAVALGIGEMGDMDGCVFCPCDQPLLKRESIIAMLEAFRKKGRGIIRLCSGEKDGTPVLFSGEYFDELAELPEKKGGGYLASIYPESVIRVQVSDAGELWDIDTPEDYEKLISEY